MHVHETSLIVIGVYLALLVVLGLVSKRLVENTSDFFRGGTRGTWWLVGSSIFMANFSAWTFTGAAAMAYKHGWSIMAIYLFPPFVAIVQAWKVGPWFRQLRATTTPEIIRMRFGPVTQQLYAILQVVAQFVYSVIALYGLSIFISAFFSVDIRLAIVSLGTVVLLYSMFGGSWAIMSADYVQSLLVIGIVAMTAALSLWQLGGPSGMFRRIDSAGLAHDFRFIKGPGEASLDKFTLQWVIALGIMYVFDCVSLTNAVRYFAVKDSREARKAALFLAVLSLIGVAIWFLPPIAGRLLFSDLVMAAPLDRPEEGAFAITSLQLLPSGMAGLLAVAIIATTLSSMDVGLNRNAAIIVREIFPAVMKAMGRAPVSNERRQLMLSRWITTVAGMAVILAALYAASRKSLGIFDIMQVFTSMIGLPITIPMGLALFIRRVPSYAAMVSVFCGFATSLVGIVQGAIHGQPWTFQFTTFIVSAATIAGFLATIPFWRHNSKAYDARVREFFERMEGPVNFEAEVGHGNDLLQLRILGMFVLISGSLSALLLFTANTTRDSLLILAFCGFLWLIGGAMLFFASVRKEVAGGCQGKEQGEAPADQRSDSTGK